MAELAGIFLSPLLQVFFERVASREFVDFFRRQKLDQTLLNNLKMALLSVNAVFEDAEEKQVTNPYVKEWLDELKDAIYDAEDILDEIDTEAMRCKLDAEFLTTTSKVRKTVSNYLKVPFVKEIEPKIKQVLDRLNDLVRQKDVIGLKEGVRGKPSERLPTTSLVEESGICGREADKEKIINFLFSDDVSGNKLFHVTAIVGMGGLGKTTLAQLVYNHEKVKEHFDLKAWACVSDDFDVFKVTKAILEGVCSSANGDGKTLNWLQSTLKESLTGKKFLFVLDDVWNNINWEVLSNPFRFGAQGSRVLITTRDERVASVMQTTFKHNLKPLPEKECWSLFVRHAFSGSVSNKHPELEAIGRQIVEKCKGLPLAVKTIGSLLWSNVDADDWNKILKSELWDMSTDQITPALRLSYKYLPSHLKRCFAYCSIYPKGHFFEKGKLVSLWMAEGLLQKSKGKTMEQVGDEYFVDLVSRSLLFQDSGPLSRFGMHDLVNDLARFVSGQFIFRLEGGNSLQVTNKTRHLSIVGQSLENIPKTLKALYEAKGLRTFLPIYVQNAILMTKFVNDSLPMFRFLRVLSFANDLNLTELPDSIGKIRHLRYLDLSWTRIRKLPDSICKLCNLQTLRLWRCWNLTALPRDMHKLVSLRHLELRGSAITEMPLHLGRLKCLQTLDIFVVNKHCGSSIGELGNLEDIGGDLVITKLQNVKSPADALDARLKNKKRLTSLELEWDPTTGNISESDQITVLKNLQPHTNLKSLTIDNYGGKSLPDWIAHPSFSKIVNLYLHNCKYCHILPSFGQLHSLQELSIIGFHGIARVGMEFYGNGSSTFKPFEALKSLKFVDMPDWKNWLCFDSKNEGEAFPRLEILRIIKCPKLTGELPIHLPSLARLGIDECSQLAASRPRSPTLRQLELTNVNEGLLNELPSGLQKLVLKGSDALQSLPEGMMDSSSPLQELEIDRCCSLMLLSDDGLPSTLKSLTISNCKKLEFPVHFNYSSLKKLYLENSCDSLRCFHVNLIAKIDIFNIKGCQNLESLINSEQHENDLAASIIRIKNCPNFVSFPDGGLRAEKLKTFEISDCGNLRSLPDRMHLLLPSLESLSIYKCPMLQSFGEGGLPTNLKSLSISECLMLQSFGEGGLPTNLESLSIQYCPMLQQFGEGGLPTNLKSLSIAGCDKLLACRTTWGLQKLPSLQDLSISGNCEGVKSFPEPDLLPMTMTSLTISGFSNMTSLDKKGLQRLTSLEYMEIYNCPNLKFGPKDGFPASISTLAIFRCPLLEKQLQNKKGKEWRKVSHIPRLIID